MIRGAGARSGARRAALALLTIAGLAGALGGCAGAASYPATQRSVKAPARIRNLSLSAVLVYLEQSGRTHLIGSVPALSSARLSIPDGLRASGTRVGLLVAPVAGHRWVGQRVLIADLRVDDLATSGWTVVDSAY